MRYRHHIVSILALGLCACQNLNRKPMLQRADGFQLVGDFEGLRAVNGSESDGLKLGFAQGLRRRFEVWQERAGEPIDYEVLVLGAGGPNGSFGAGILVGWSESGERPEFDLVTGVSAGALIAPFAFVGSQADQSLVALFAHAAPEDIYRERLTLAGLLGESLMDSQPLSDRIAEFVDRDFLQAVAAAHGQGRRLYVGTTDFDLGQFVIWDMGAIAARGTQEAHDLFRKVLLASASIPIFYPPVLIAVEDGAGVVGDEMHVDGGVLSPMFVPNQVIDALQATRQEGLPDVGPVQRRMTVIHNGALLPTVEAAERDTFYMAIRTYLMVSWSMVQEDVAQLYLLSRLWGSEFRFAYLPVGVEINIMDFTPEDTFRLFERGREWGLDADAWRSAPPDFLIPEEYLQVKPIFGADPEGL